jgi:C-terminal processing protease CtpA/Prc
VWWSETTNKETTMLSNEQAVQAYQNRLSIEEAVAKTATALKELNAQFHELTHELEAAQATSEVFEGIAMRVDEGRVLATSYEVERSALAYEHVMKPGTFLVRVETRHKGDRVLKDAFQSMEEAIFAAKSFVAGV